ncbi:MAG: hypothetical protein ACI92X_000475 [Dokdonia sp.]
MFSCGNVTPKHKFSIIYEFENLDKVSANDKLGTAEVLNKRLDKFASNYEVRLNNTQQIEIKLSTDFELDAINKIVTNSGKLDFWEVIKREELGSFFIKVNNYYNTGNDAISPFSDLIQGGGYGYGLFSLAVWDTVNMRTLLDNKEIKYLLPTSLRQSKFLFGLPDENGFLPL